MQAIKLIIPGSFWDSQIYSGHLYLFTDDGEINIVNWEKAIAKIADNNKHLKLVLQVAFLESDLLYARSAQLLLEDEEISSILINRFTELAKLDLTFKSVNDSILASNRQDNPFPFPHADTEIYYNRIYVGLKSGIFSSECRTGARRIEKRQVEKHWDAPVLSVAGSNGYTALALASGQNGLHELKVELKENHHLEPKPVAKLHCTSCDWLYQSIYGSSNIQPAFLASFEKPPSGRNFASKKPERKVDKIITSEKVFGSEIEGFSWGVHDKIYSYSKGAIDVISYDPKRKNDQFKPKGHIPLEAWKGDVISASAAPFGMIIECDNALVVIKSNDEIITFDGEPVSWRVFPRTRNYTNQLHIIYDNRLEIWSFNHDYFINQKDKIFGSKAHSLDDE